MSFIEKIIVNKNDDSTVTITGEIPYSELEVHREDAIKHLGKNIAVDGFRPGYVPSKILIEKIGEMNILSETAERALAKNYPSILQHHNIDAIGYPSVSITKIAINNPLGFTINVAVVPEFELPNYTEIASTHNKRIDRSVTISDEEIDSTIKDIVKRKITYDRLQEKKLHNSKETTELPTPDNIKENEHSEDKEITDEQIPEITDELANQLGGFSTVDELKNKVREELTERKIQEIKTKQRSTISEALISATSFTVPKVMIDAEMEQFMAQLKEDLKKANISLEDYLSHINKKEDELKDEWQPSAEKRAKIQLILNAIADKENIKPDQKIVDEQVKMLIERYKDADKNSVETYIVSILRNEAVMNLLEEKSKKTDTKKSN